MKISYRTPHIGRYRENQASKLFTLFCGESQRTLDKHLFFFSRKEFESSQELRYTKDKFTNVFLHNQQNRKYISYPLHFQILYQSTTPLWVLGVCVFGVVSAGKTNPIV